VRVQAGGKTLWGQISFGLNLELIWSPDSKSFVLSGSHGGLIGIYHATAFFIDHGELKVSPLTPLIWKTFGQPVKCGWPEPPNVVALRWIDNENLLLAAQITPHSVCDSMGTFRSYIVEAKNRRIMGTLNQIETKKRFGSDLGPNLKEADDECVRNPKSCWIAANHERPARKRSQPARRASSR
jgi:hypothetical protein